MPHSLRRRWTTCLATVATLLSTAVGVGVTAAPSASAGTGVVFDGGTPTGGFLYLQSAATCYVCGHGVTERFTAAVSGPVVTIILKTPNTQTPPTVAIDSVDNYPHPGSTRIVTEVSSSVANPGESAATTTYVMSGDRVTAGQEYELVVSGPDVMSQVGVGSNPGHYWYNYDIGYSYTQSLAVQILETKAAEDMPTVSVDVSPSSPDGTNGWYKTTPTVHFTCGGDLDVSDCPADYPVADGEYP